LSWSPNADQRNLFVEILGEVARGFEEPGRPRGPELLRIAAADAALLGFEDLSSVLKGLSGRFQTNHDSSPSPAALSRGLEQLARTLERGGDVGAGLESLSSIESEPKAPVVTPSAPSVPPAPAAPPARDEAPAPSTAAAPAAPPAREAASAPSVDPAPAPGGTVRIFLESAPPPPPVSAGPTPASAWSPAPAMAAGRALLVDPAPVHRAVLARLMRRMRWDVRELDAAQPALEAVFRGEADVLIVDARRLRLEPGSLVAEVRRRSGGRAVPVVFLVEDGHARDEQDLLKAGAAALLRRPTDETALRRTLDSIRFPGGNA
jgi:CheY-like chemotaxis protein